MHTPRLATSVSTALFAFVVLVSGGAMAQTQLDNGGDEARQSLVDTLRRTYQPFHETTRVNREGTREDRVMLVRAGWDELLRKHFDAYRFGRAIEGGSHCKGYFVSPAKRLATFTIEHGGRSFMVMSQETSDGVELTVWGASRLAQDLRKPPTRQARPYYRAVPDAPVRSYGL
jgi:hypothetical protein